ncbi:MAG: cyclic nucleotide-binding domain-containing protein [Bradymonadales bacterium]|nr:cyclic nucleotide-binding domain-containing protein [Bradymonadales bacterium]
MHRAYNIIRQTPPFSPLSEDEFTAFKRCTSTCNLSEHTLLCQSGDDSDTAFILAEGKVVELWADGVVTHQKPGTILQPSALLSEESCAHTLVARTDTEVIKIGRKAFLKMLQKQQLVAYVLLEEIAKELAHQIRDLNRCLNQLLQDNHCEPRG